MAYLLAPCQTWLIGRRLTVAGACEVIACLVVKSLIARISALGETLQARVNETISAALLPIIHDVFRADRKMWEGKIQVIFCAPHFRLPHFPVCSTAAIPETSC
jgi:hypothetical protein